MKKLITAAILLVMATMSANAQLVINELMQSNVECIMDDIHEFPDSWVELYNSGTTAVNLQNYKIGTKNKANKAWQLPDSIIAPKGHVIIYCDKEARTDKRLHTDFRLESDKVGNLYLFQGSAIVNSVEGIPMMPAPDIAYGRAKDGQATDGGETWGYELNPTPGDPNSGGVVAASKILGAPEFSKPGRVSNTAFNLTLSLPKGAPRDAVIRYTTNGSEPRDTSTLYNGPITINSTKVIRAKVFCDTLLSPVSTAQSYIFHPRTMKVPIFSVQTDSLYLHGADSLGLFKYNTKKEHKKTCDWRRPVNIEMFVPEDSVSVFNQLGETRIQGGQSRANALKSMVFYANKRFDPAHRRFSNYEFFPDQKPGVTEFKSFSLRDGGNDFSELYFRDLIIQRTMGQNTDIDWQAGHTAVLYINGKYMGMLNIRERSNEDNIYSNYNGLEDIDMVEISHEQEKVNNQVVNNLFIEEFKGSEDTTFYNGFKRFYSEEKVHSLAEYEQWLDVSEYLNIMIMNLFYGNIDFPGNNLVFWRPNDDDTKSGLPKRFRVIAKDVDYGLGLYGWNETKNTFNTISWIYNLNNSNGRSWAFTEQATRLFRNMMESPDIRDLFIDKCCVYMGDFMNGNGTGEMIDSIKAEAMEEFVAHRDKYSPNTWGGNRNDITNRFNAAKTWAEGRPDEFIKHMRQHQEWGLGTAIPVTINKEVDAANLPDEVYVNGIKLTKGVFDGKLFEGRQITLEGKTNVTNDKIVTGWEIKKTPNYGTAVTTTVDGATCTFTMPLAKDYKSLSIKAIMGDKPQITGDVNHDGKVDVADVTTLVDHILGNTPQGFNPNNCDVNNDSKIDVSDVTSLVDIILNND